MTAIIFYLCAFVLFIISVNGWMRKAPLINENSGSCFNTTHPKSFQQTIEEKYGKDEFSSFIIVNNTSRNLINQIPTN